MKYVFAMNTWTKSYLTVTAHWVSKDFTCCTECVTSQHTVANLFFSPSADSGLAGTNGKVILFLQMAQLTCHKLEKWVITNICLIVHTLQLVIKIAY